MTMLGYQHAISSIIGMDEGSCQPQYHLATRRVRRRVPLPSLRFHRRYTPCFFRRCSTDVVVIVPAGVGLCHCGDRGLFWPVCLDPSAVTDHGSALCHINPDRCVPPTFIQGHFMNGTTFNEILDSCFIQSFDVSVLM